MTAHSRTVEADTRPEIFAPVGDALPLFFLHIPKTAGSSNNAFLRSVYGDAQVQTHVENLLPLLLAGTVPPVRNPCVTGHVPLWAWSLYRDTSAFARVTLLRDPWARLVSHINWVARYAQGERLPPGAGGAALGRIAKHVVETDFETAAGLRRLMGAVKQERDFTSFDNLQVRMLRTGRMDAMTKPIGQTDIEVACRELSGFLAFGFCEDQAGFQADLAEKLGADVLRKGIKKNVSKQNVVSISNALAHEVLAPWIAADMALVGFAKGLAQARAGY